MASRELDARTVAQRALDIARQHKERGHEAYTLLFIGEIAAREDPVDIGKAETHYRRAFGLAEKLGMRPLVAHCHVGLGNRKGYAQLKNFGGGGKRVWLQLK